MHVFSSLCRSALLLVVGIFVSGALAAAERPYSDAEFAAAQRSGKPVLLAVHADWCPTCRAQEQVLKELFANKQYAGISVFRVDFDSQKAVLKRFGVRNQSTLILFKGNVEVARSIAQTDRNAIAADLAKAL